MKYAQDDDGCARLEAVDDPIVSVENDPDGAACSRLVGEAALREAVESFGKAVDPTDRLGCRLGAGLRDVLENLAQPVGSFLSPPYFC